MTRHFSLILAVLAIPFSCARQYNVRELAIKTETYTEMNAVIEFYSVCNYRLPENSDQLLDFLAEWKIQDPDSYLYDSFYPTEKSFIDLIKNNNLQWEFYTDSVFVYSSSLNLGTCVYGHPFYWLEHPERFPEERHDYFDNFRPAIFDYKGNFIFRFDIIQKLKEGMNLIKEKHGNTVMIKNKLKKQIALPWKPYIRAMIICSYDGSGDIKIETPLPEEFFILDKTSNEITSGRINLEESLRPMFEELTDLMQKTLIENPTVNKVMFTTELHFN